MYYKSIYTFISIHAPRVGCDLTCYYGCGHLPHFNPRTPGGVRPQPVVSASVAAYISIHAPRVGCDNLGGGVKAKAPGFQSTHPGWGATNRAFSYTCICTYFNPRTPGGVRPKGATSITGEDKFQSTHPGWGATLRTISASPSQLYFNPRTPGGVRLLLGYIFHLRSYFNPRTPGGVRHS